MTGNETDGQIGQMHPEERSLLYDIVREISPKICIESGTRYGGGSTFYILNGLKDNNCGKLYTWEIEYPAFTKCIEFYKSHLDLVNYCNWTLGDFIEGVKVFTNVDFALLDGPEDAVYTKECFDLLSPKMKTGGVMVMHDWKTTKCELLRANMHEIQKDWNIKNYLEWTTSGLMVLQKR